MTSQGTLEPVGFEKSISGALPPARHPQTIAALIDSLPTGLNQVTAACPGFP